MAMARATIHIEKYVGILRENSRESRVFNENGENLVENILV